MAQLNSRMSVHAGLRDHFIPIGEDVRERLQASVQIFAFLDADAGSQQGRLEDHWHAQRRQRPAPFPASLLLFHHGIRADRQPRLLQQSFLHRLVLADRAAQHIAFTERQMQHAAEAGSAAILAVDAMQDRKDDIKGNGPGKAPGLIPDQHRLSPSPLDVHAHHPLQQSVQITVMRQLPQMLSAIQVPLLADMAGIAS